VGKEGIWNYIQNTVVLIILCCPFFLHDTHAVHMEVQCVCLTLCHTGLLSQNSNAKCQAFTLDCSTD